MAERISTVIVGAGLAGLAAAVELTRAGVPFVLFEAGDAPGGRVRTDRVDGFLLDRGFQVLLTAYPEAKRLLDYRSLDLQNFYPGAFLAREGRLRLMADPWRRPLDAVGSIFDDSASWGDRWRIAKSRVRAAGDHTIGPEEISAGRPVGGGSHSWPTTREYFRMEGFSERFRESFLEPFFRGVFLDPDLDTDARAYAFVFGMMARGDTAIPRLGMEEIPRQLAAALPQGSVRLEHRCLAIEPEDAGGGSARFERTGSPGETVNIKWDRLILAVEEPAACRLLGWPEPSPGRQTTCVYFAAKRNPVPRPALVLFHGDGPVNHLAVPSALSPAYAPEGQHLVAVNAVGPVSAPSVELIASIRVQLRAWFGGAIDGWRHLATASVPFAQPNQDAGVFERRHERQKPPRGVWVAGDYVTNASIDGALRSGTRAAEDVLRTGVTHSAH